ncbi:DUF4129 domain-containing protein [Micromonospora halophytica]|uniref:Protein-glutamine gamma-glutamyltransferase-like C-terminal domain-containing protein n=1 Tax=Micromonospora halophytica TaxID=47864 RepID=A0A1C5HA13_9ACTN|nr:DUF4129 domain-containing protein [Micromonospora halophytica]SCG42855.1 protein of unknown function [Micromonospora halophytica]
MSFSRWWTEATAALGDLVPLPLAAVLLLLTAALAALAWYHFPAWVPRRLPRLPRFRRPRRKRRRRRRPEADVSVAEVPRPRDGGSDAPAGAGLCLADRLAAEGRFAEAVRERLRDMVRRLVAVGVVEQRPGMTVTELADEAARNRPPVDPPLRAAGTIFSELWYAHHPASAAHDRRMRELADELDRVLAGHPEEPR